MSDLNNFTGTGRLGADAELKYLQGGSAVWSARVGVGYGFGERKGTNWLTVQVFGKRAESLGGLDLKKGAAIGFTGELRIREYERDNGGKGYAHEVSANDVALLGAKPEGQARNGSSGAPRPSAGGQSPPSRGNEPFPDDDIPF